MLLLFIKVIFIVMRCNLFFLLCFPMCFAVVAGRRLSELEAEEKCSKFEALFSNIDADLERWRRNGISLELMQRTVTMHTTRKPGQKGFAAGFWKGKVCCRTFMQHQVLIVAS